MKRFILAAVLLLSFSSVGVASDLKVSDAWARASAGMARAGAAFLAIHNMGEDDKLIAAKADVSEKVELHTHIHDNGVMKMRQVEFIPAQNGMTMLQPGGYHVMFINLTAPLKEGTSFPLTLTFEKAGDVTLDVMVKAPGAMGMKMKHGDK